MPAHAIYKNAPMNKRLWVRLPDDTFRAIMEIVDAEQARTGEKVEPGTIARRLIHEALDVRETRKKRVA